MNLIGTPVTALTDSAAPPRASPSSLVMITPSSSSASLNALALLTASWPVMRVDDQVDLVGLDAAVDLRELLHQLVVDVQPAGRVENHHVWRRSPWPACTACWQTATGSLAPGSA